MSSAAAIISSYPYSQARETVLKVLSSPVDDIFTATAAGPTIQLDVLANDNLVLSRTDTSIVLNTTGTAGTEVFVNNENCVNYTPPATAQTDTFTYTIDGNGPATVSIVVQDVSDELFTLMDQLPLDGYWRHGDLPGGTLTDSSGEGNNGTITGTPTFGVDPELTDVTNLERAIQYNATASASVSLSALSTCAYSVRFKPTQTDINNEVAILNRNSAGNNEGNWSFRLLNSGGGKVFFQDGVNPQVSLFIPSGFVQAGNWCHVWILMGPLGVSLYFNGDLVDSNTGFTIGEASTTESLQIATSNYSNNFTGVIHEVARSVVLPTPAEISERSFFTEPTPGGALSQTDLPTPLRQVSVSNQTQLNAALADLQSGDQINLADGNYSGFTITTSGTSANPIVFKANNTLGATFTSQIFVDAGNVTFYGTDHTARIVVGYNASAPNFKFWRCRIRDVSGIAVRTYSAADPDFAFSEWDNIRGRGCLVSYQNGTRRPVWRYCWFHDTPPGYGPQESGGNGEFIHLGDNGSPGGMNDPMNALIYRCKVKAWNADTEQPSIKCSGNTIRQTTIEDCLGGSGNGRLNIRFGFNNTIEGCWSRNSGGIGVRQGCPTTGKGVHKILGNVVEASGNGSIEIKAGNAEGCDDSNSPKPFRGAARGCVVSGNTGRVVVGDWSSSSQDDTVRARDTRIRQHSGDITLVFESNTDSQPTAIETEYEWASAIFLNDSDVGPFATGSI